MQCEGHQCIGSSGPVDAGSIRDDGPMEAETGVAWESCYMWVDDQPRVASGCLLACWYPSWFLSTQLLAVLMYFVLDMKKNWNEMVQRASPAPAAQPLFKACELILLETSKSRISTSHVSGDSSVFCTVLQDCLYMALLPGSETPWSPSMVPYRCHLCRFTKASLTSGSGWFVGFRELWLCGSGVDGESYTTEDGLGGSKDLLNNISEMTTADKKNSLFFHFKTII